MRFLDADHPFFAVRWRRWATALAPAAWAGVELWRGDPFWALLFGVLAAYAAWVLLLPRRG